MPTAKLTDIIGNAHDQPRSYSSTQVDLPKNFAEIARAWAARIPDASLAEDGRETDPHITVKYGLHDTDPAPVQKILENAGPITAKVKGVSIFPASESGGADVVKLDIESKDLTRLNKEIAALPHTDTFPKYQPHITLAYVKPGEGKKWAGKLIPGLSGKTITFGSVTFSPSEGDKSDIPLNASKQGGKQGAPPAKEQKTQGKILSSLDKDGVRRVTGSADIPLNADGKEQSKKLAQTKVAKPFDMVFSSPEKRAMQTAKEFGKPIQLAGLDAWRRGSLESKPVDATKGTVKMLMLNPDKRPPGKSPISGELGESLNEFARPLLATVQAIMAMVKPDERVLVVSHGGNMQVIDAWLRAGSQESLDFDHKKMAARPYWTVVGKLFLIGEKELQEVQDDEQAGKVYLMEHASTDYNDSSASGKSESSGAAPAKPSEAPSPAKSEAPASTKPPRQ